MAISATVDLTKYNRSMAGLHDAFLGRGMTGDAATIVQDEAARAAALIVRLSPPKTQAQGRNAIETDLKKLIGTADAGTLARVTLNAGRDNIDGWLAQDDGSTIHLLWDKVTTSPQEIASIHKQHRNRRGRVSGYRRGSRGKWYRTVVTTEAVRSRYIKQVQKKAGFLKGSWAATLVALRVHVAGWIAKHSTANPAAIVHTESLRNPLKPSITFGSRAPGVGKSRVDIQSAINKRAAAMTKRAQLVISGYAKDVRAGMKPRRKARKELVNVSA